MLGISHIKSSHQGRPRVMHTCYREALSDYSLPQDLQYGHAGVLGLAPTWPQAAAALPSPGAPFDWQGDRPLGLPMEDLVIYEMHVRGFTWGGSAGVRAPGARPA